MVPSGYEWQLLDWDNLLARYLQQPATPAASGKDSHLNSRMTSKENYPEEYAKIQERIAEDAAKEAK